MHETSRRLHVSVKLLLKPSAVTANLSGFTSPLLQCHQTYLAKAAVCTAVHRLGFLDPAGGGSKLHTLSTLERQKDFKIATSSAQFAIYHLDLESNVNKQHFFFSYFQHLGDAAASGRRKE